MNTPRPDPQSPDPQSPDPAAGPDSPDPDAGVSGLRLGMKTPRLLGPVLLGAVLLCVVPGGTIVLALLALRWYRKRRKAARS